MLYQLFQRARGVRTADDDSLPTQDALAWQFSLAAHLVIFAALSLLVISAPEPPLTLEVSFTPDTETEELEMQEFLVTEQAEPSETAIAEFALPDLHVELPLTDNLGESDVDLPVLNAAAAPVEFETNILALGERQLAAPVTVRGLSGAATGSIGGAVDRLTAEILFSLEQRPTLVVWLLDASPSMRQKREQIASRFATIYRQLDASRQRGHRGFSHSGGAPLLTSVVSFGQTKPILETAAPTDDFQKLTQAVSGIQDDPSGIESTFSAVGYVAETFAKFRRAGRNVMLIVATDEAGDDSQQADAAIAALSRRQMPLYVIGYPAPFGCEKTAIRFHMPADDTYAAADYWVAVRLGPESAHREVLQMTFWSKSQSGDPSLIDSGFGPFHLARACHESGGIYFSLYPGHINDKPDEVEVRLDQVFDPRVMRRYAPDYVSEAEYVRRLHANKACAGLVQASELTRLDRTTLPPSRFPAATPAQLNSEVNEAQKWAARLEPRIEQVYELLRLGEADRARLTAPRWQAGYDLAMGRICAAKVRNEGYNALLAALKRGDHSFQLPDSDTWEVHLGETILTGSQHEKLAALARRYLQRVINEHPGTPWAWQAERELATPLGWELGEAHTGAGQTRPVEPGVGGKARNSTSPGLPRRSRGVPKEI